MLSSMLVAIDQQLHWSESLSRLIMKSTVTQRVLCSCHVMLFRLNPFRSLNPFSMQSSYEIVTCHMSTNQVWCCSAKQAGIKQPDTQAGPRLARQ